MYHFSNQLVAKSKLGRKEKYKHYKWGKFETIFDCVVQKKKTSFFSFTQLPNGTWTQGSRLINKK